MSELERFLQNVPDPVVLDVALPGYFQEGGGGIVPGWELRLLTEMSRRILELEREVERLEP